MVKRKFNAKPTPSLPKGLPFPKSKRAKLASNERKDIHNLNPFENARASSAKAPKFKVHNRTTTITSSHTHGPQSALKRAIESRKNAMATTTTLQNQRSKVGAFVDRRIGEGRGGDRNQMTEEERMLARMVRERVSRSKRHGKFALDDDYDDGIDQSGITLTHRGKVIDETYNGKRDDDDVYLSDDDRYGGNLEGIDTELHFGGGAFDKSRQKAASNNPYGPSGGTSGAKESLGDRYRTRKEELDDLIMRKKFEKVEKAKRKEEQADTFEGMDDRFKELASLLQFRDKDDEERKFIDAKKAGKLSTLDEEMDEWDRETKELLFERKVKATDRTKTAEEIAKDEAERLNELETKRLARMSGDFDDDDLSDISDVDSKKHKHSKSKSKSASKNANNQKNRKGVKNPDELDSDQEENEEHQIKFTADGLVYIDKEGNVVKKVGDEDDDDCESREEGDDEVDSDEEDSDDETSSSNDEQDSDDDASALDDDDASSAQDDDDSEEDDDNRIATNYEMLKKGTKIKARFRADEQFQGKGKWYPGTITKVKKDAKTGDILYDVEYDDGDFEEGVKPQHIKTLSIQNDDEQNEVKAQASKLQMKRQKAKERARTEIPYVFEVPTTLEALNDLISTHAATGSDANLIVQRIHASNSVRADRRNREKMQNFYDVILRRFISVGDAIGKYGDGGEELVRYEQLDSLTRTLYHMAQDDPGIAEAIWSRRLGIFYNAHSKRLRDSEFVGIDDETDFTAWPSTGQLFLLRAVGHIFPVTDFRHTIISPTLLFLGQILAQTPLRSLEDISKGLFCAALMIEFTKDSKRLPSEAISYIASVFTLFSRDAIASVEDSPIPSFSNVIKMKTLGNLRKQVIDCFDGSSHGDGSLKLSLEKDKIDAPTMATSLLLSALYLVQKLVVIYEDSLNASESEVFYEISKGLILLDPVSIDSKLPNMISKEIAKTAGILSEKLKLGQPRVPLSRRSAAKASELAIETFAPRMDDPSKYKMPKDRNKSKTQAEQDKARREYKREHKAVSRELRLDAAFFESERRKEKQLRDNKAREKRHKNFAWLEQEQATLNQQVAQGGGLLKGGGIGAARSKAASGALGIKRGGKF